MDGALGRVLAKDVIAKRDAPGFDNSAMDGFAALAGAAGRELRIVGESRAGAPFAGDIGKDEAIRISTGAAVPAGIEIGVLPPELTADCPGTVLFTPETTPGRSKPPGGE